AALQELADAAVDGKAELFSQEPLERVGLAMFSSGWFVEKPTVRRVDGARVVVEGAWRVPAAVVRRGGIGPLVSWDGYPLPLRTLEGKSKFPAILNIAHGAPLDAAGGVDHTRAWEGEDIAASLELLQVLLRQPWASQVAGVDASAYAPNGSLTI